MGAPGIRDIAAAARLQHSPQPRRRLRMLPGPLCRQRLPASSFLQNCLLLGILAASWFAPVACDRADNSHERKLNSTSAVAVGSRSLRKDVKLSRGPDFDEDELDSFGSQDSVFDPLDETTQQDPHQPESPKLEGSSSGSTSSVVSSSLPAGSTSSVVSGSPHEGVDYTFLEDSGELGMEVDADPPLAHGDTLVVMKVKTDSPAFNAGITEGSQILKIDGKSAETMTKEDFEKALKNEDRKRLVFTILPSHVSPEILSQAKSMDKDERAEQIGFPPTSPDKPDLLPAIGAKTSLESLGDEDIVDDSDHGDFDELEGVDVSTPTEGALKEGLEGPSSPTAGLKPLEKSPSQAEHLDHKDEASLNGSHTSEPLGLNESLSSEPLVKVPSKSPGDGLGKTGSISGLDEHAMQEGSISEEEHSPSPSMSSGSIVVEPGLEDSLPLKDQAGLTDLETDQEAIAKNVGELREEAEHPEPQAPSPASVAVQELSPSHEQPITRRMLCNMFHYRKVALDLGEPTWDEIRPPGMPSFRQDPDRWDLVITCPPLKSVPEKFRDKVTIDTVVVQIKEGIDHVTSWMVNFKDLNLVQPEDGNPQSETITANLGTPLGPDEAYGRLGISWNASQWSPSMLPKLGAEADCRLHAKFYWVPTPELTTPGELPLMTEGHLQRGKSQQAGRRDLVTVLQCCPTACKSDSERTIYKQFL